MGVASLTGTRVCIKTTQHISPQLLVKLEACKSDKNKLLLQAAIGFTAGLCVHCKATVLPLPYHTGASVLYFSAIHVMQWGVTIQWTGLLDWNTGLDYWTDLFLVFTHSEVGFIESC